MYIVGYSIINEIQTAVVNHFNKPNNFISCLLFFVENKKRIWTVLCNAAIYYIFMANHNDLGSLGEQLAQEYLQDLNYTLVAQNWQWGKAEVDIIAYDQEALVFVEVKTRQKATFGPPELAVTPKKQQLLYDLATEYMYQIEHEQEFRFDVIAIIIEPNVAIQHFPDAFFPNWMSNTDF